MASKKLFVSKTGISKGQLMAVMSYHLSSFNDEQETITNDTVHKRILSDTDGVTSSTCSKNIYKGIIRWTMSANGHSDKAWPNNWMDLSIDQLATKIL